MQKKNKKKTNYVQYQTDSCTILTLFINSAGNVCKTLIPPFGTLWVCQQLNSSLAFSTNACLITISVTIYYLRWAYK